MTNSTLTVAKGQAIESLLTTITRVKEAKKVLEEGKNVFIRPTNEKVELSASDIESGLADDAPWFLAAVDAFLAELPSADVGS